MSLLQSTAAELTGLGHVIHAPQDVPQEEAAGRNLPSCRLRLIKIGSVESVHGFKPYSCGISVDLLNQTEKKKHIHVEIYIYIHIHALRY
jgi:hypothetical protein